MVSGGGPLRVSPGMNYLGDSDNELSHSKKAKQLYLSLLLLSDSHPSSASRTSLAKSVTLNGFCMKRTPSSSTLWCAMTFAV